MVNDTSSQQLIADILRKGDFSPYVDQLRERASKGDTSAAFVLGYIYLSGKRGVRRDYKEAICWFERVNLKDDVTGFVASHLATLYFKGLGVEKDRQRAFKYLRSAVLHGHHNSRVFLAILQKTGDGTLRKPHSAELLLRASVCDPKVHLVIRLVALRWLYF